MKKGYVATGVGREIPETLIVGVTEKTEIVTLETTEITETTEIIEIIETPEIAIETEERVGQEIIDHQHPQGTEEIGTRKGQIKTKTEKMMITETTQTKSVLDHPTVRIPGKERRWRRKEKVKKHKSNLKISLETIMNKVMRSHRNITSRTKNSRNSTCKNKNKMISRSNHKIKKTNKNLRKKQLTRTPSRIKVHLTR